MRNFVAISVACVALVIGAGSASATSYHLSPVPVDLNDLDHYSYYTWGINTPWSGGETITSASIFIDNIANSDGTANSLFIHLLDTGTLGVTAGTDSGGISDQFNGQGVLLKTYTNLGTTPQDLTYTFTAAQVTSLMTFSADGRFALGIDPDCHYFNDGFYLDVVTTGGSGGVGPVPEPITMLSVLLGAGSVGAYIRRRKLATAA